MSGHACSTDNLSEFGHDYGDSDADRKFCLLKAMLIAEATSSSDPGGICVSAGDVIGIAIASFLVGTLVSWSSVILGRFLKKPPEKITEDGTPSAERVSREDDHD